MYHHLVLQKVAKTWSRQDLLDLLPDNLKVDLKPKKASTTSNSTPPKQTVQKSTRKHLSQSVKKQPSNTTRQHTTCTASKSGPNSILDTLKRIPKKYLIGGTIGTTTGLAALTAFVHNKVHPTKQLTDVYRDDYYH